MFLIKITPLNNEYYVRIFEELYEKALLLANEFFPNIYIYDFHTNNTFKLSLIEFQEKLLNNDLTTNPRY